VAALAVLTSSVPVTPQSNERAPVVQTEAPKQESPRLPELIERLQSNAQSDELGRYALKYEAAVAQFQQQRRDGSSRNATWILSGQSNACGRAEGIGVDPSARVLMLEPQSGSWHVAREPLLNMNGSLGSFHSAATAYSMRRSDRTVVRLAGYARGNRSISFWDAGAEGWERLAPILAAAGKEASAFIWYHGENDGVYREGISPAAYHASLRNLADRVRASCGNPKLLFVVIQLGNTTDKRSFFPPIREAQRLFVAGDARALLVPAIGLSLQDTAHLTREGYLALGVSLAEALTRHEEGRGSWPGPAMDGATLGEDPRTVQAHFAEVNQLQGVLAEDFAVYSEDRFVPCERVSVRKRTVTLHFPEPVPFPAKLIYAYGNNPIAALRDEAGHPAPAAQCELTRGVPVADEAATQSPQGAGCH
jgi:hypothetical protein